MSPSLDWLPPPDTSSSISASTTSPLQAPLNPEKSAHPRARNTPCSSCRIAREKCVWIKGSQECNNCSRRGVGCSGPKRVNALKCAPCHTMKMKCEWLDEDDGQKICVRCAKVGRDCPGPRPIFVEENVEVIKPPPRKRVRKGFTSVKDIGPSSTMSRISMDQLSLSLAYHCITMCCKTEHVSLGGGDPALYMDYFHSTRSLSRPSVRIAFFEEVLTSLIIFTGATLSNHSAFTGSSSSPSYTNILSSSSSPSLFPTLSSRRSSALLSLSNALSSNTLKMLNTVPTSFAEALEQLGLVRLVLSKATAVNNEWQKEVLEKSLRRSLALLRICKGVDERDQLFPLVRNFAFKSILNAATDPNGRSPLSETELDLIFGPPSLIPPVTSTDIISYISSPSSALIWSRVFRDIYNHLARVFSQLLLPTSTPNRTLTLSTVWKAIDGLSVYNQGLFEGLQKGDGMEDERMKVRYSTVVRSLLAFKVNYWKMAAAVKKRLKSSKEEERMFEGRVVRGVAEDVGWLLSLPVLLPRKLEVLNHQISVLLNMPADELTRDFLGLSPRHREALLQGIGASVLLVRGHTAAHLEALVDLLLATDPRPSTLQSKDNTELEAGFIPKVHVASSILDILNTSSTEPPVTALFVLVVVPLVDMKLDEDMSSRTVSEVPFRSFVVLR